MTKTMKDLFIDELHDMLSAEHQISKALPKMAAAAESPELKKAFLDHLKETKGQIDRLNKVFKLLKVAPTEKLCVATKGLIEEGQELLEEYEKSSVRDAGLISKAQRIEHYEISAYGTLCAFAKELDLANIATLLHQTFNEESKADQKLSMLAIGSGSASNKRGINHLANAALAKNMVTKATPAKKAVAPKVTSVSSASSKKSVAKTAAKNVAPKAAASKAAPKKASAPSHAKISPAKKTTVKTPVVAKKAPAKKAATVIKAPAKKNVAKSPTQKVVAKKSASQLIQKTAVKKR